MNMDCNACQNLLNAYLDGELEGIRFAEVERHLDQCRTCKAELERLVRMRELLSELREVEVPEGEREAFISALRERLEAEQTRGVRREINWRPALVSGIAVVIILIVLVSIPHQVSPVKIAPASGLNPMENAFVDRMISGALDDHFLATSGDFLADPALTTGQVLSVWKVVRQTHGELFEPAE